MRLFDLTLKNIGPFKEAELTFIGEDNDQKQPPVTIITGENGTGKTIILDAIRSLLMGTYGSIERDIIRETSDFGAALNLSYRGKKELLEAFQSSRGKSFNTNITPLNILFAGRHHNQEDLNDKNWVADYWTSKPATDEFNITNIVPPNLNPNYYLSNTLNGVRQNVEVTQLICFFDYLRSSESLEEKKVGEYLYGQLKKLIKLSLNDGELAYVSRRRLQPIIRQNGQEITLDKLSSGNLYLIQRMVSLLGKMYSVHLLKNTPVEEICDTQGLLLIDEAENHLHPKWQKTFIKSVQEIFPNLQIILTTHSPFIVSSIENARIYVCESQGDHCIVKDETAEYSNKPIEEILLSPLFGGTYPFNAAISGLLQRRKQAIQAGDKQEEQQVEKQLKAINPDYFAYLDIDNLLGEISKVNK